MRERSSRKGTHLRKRIIGSNGKSIEPRLEKSISIGIVHFPNDLCGFRVASNVLDQHSFEKFSGWFSHGFKPSKVGFVMVLLGCVVVV